MFPEIDDTSVNGVIDEPKDETPEPWDPDAQFPDEIDPEDEEDNLDLS